MPEIFPHFIDDPMVFQQAKAFWKKLAYDEAETLGQQGEWEKWAHEEDWSNDPELVDGAVVFTLFSASQHKGLRVQQSALSVSPDKKPYVSSFMDVVGDGLYQHPIPNLFIGAIPTEENLPLIRRLVNQWFRNDVDSDKMRSFIETEVYEKKG
jgi:hypothetical protein